MRLALKNCYDEIIIRSKHRLARGVGKIIKTLIEDTRYTTWLQTQYGINLEAMLNEKLVLSPEIHLNVRQ